MARVHLGLPKKQLFSRDKVEPTASILDDGIDGVSVYHVAQGPEGILAAATSAGIFTSADGGDRWEQSELR